MYSSSSSSGSSASTGVLGLIPTPRMIPRSGSLTLIASPEGLEHAVGLAGALHVEGDHVGARRDEGIHLVERVVDHEVDVLEDGGPDRLHDRRARR